MKKILFAFIIYFPFEQAHAQNSVVVSNGSFVKLSNSAQIVLVDASLINDGNISLVPGDGTFAFKGTVNSTISGSSKPVFDVLQIDKTSSQLILQRDVDVAGSVNFTGGVIDLNTHVLDLGSTGTLLNENESNHFIGPAGGYIQWTGSLTAPSSVNPGNLGAIITSAQNLGITTIRRGHVSQTNGSGTGSSILRYYDIIPTTNSSLNATLRFTYLDVELNSLSESSLTVWKSSNLTNWTNVGFDSRSTASNYVEKNSINDFSRWTLTTPGNALPVQFGVFSTRCNGNSVMLKWVTESEINTQVFEIQRSGDAMNWVTISNLPAAGNSTSRREYSFTDNASQQTSFYRIAEIDINGRINYSAASKISCGNNAPFRLWPNPATSQIWLSVSVTASGPAELKIIDSKGSVVYVKNIQLFSGNNIVNLNTPFASGNYIVQLTNGIETKWIKMTKQ